MIRKQKRRNQRRVCMNRMLVRKCWCRYSKDWIKTRVVNSLIMLEKRFLGDLPTFTRTCIHLYLAVVSKVVVRGRMRLRVVVALLPVRWPHAWTRSLSGILGINRKLVACYCEWNTDWCTHTIPNRLRMFHPLPFCPLVHDTRPDCLPSYLGSMQENSSSSWRGLSLSLHPHLV